MRSRKKVVRIVCHGNDGSLVLGNHLRTVEVQIAPDFKLLRLYIPLERKWISMRGDTWSHWEESVLKVLCGEQVDKSLFVSNCTIRNLTEKDVVRIRRWRLLHDV